MTRSVGLVLTGALVLMLFTMLAGRPLVYTDTRAYYALGEQVAQLAHIAPKSDAAITLGEGTESPEASAARQRLAYTVAGSRSVYYSTWLYLLVRMGGLWFLTFIQAVIVAATLLLFVRTFLGERQMAAAYAGTIAVLATFSSLPIYVAFVMPDLAAGLTIIAAVLLILRWQSLMQYQRWLMLLLLLLTCLFHPTHVLVALGLSTFALLASWLFHDRAGSWRIGALATGVAAIAAVLAGMLYPLGVRVVRHESIYSPPFLTARVVADGPGRDYLRSSCAAGERWALCPYASKPLDSSDDFLWKSHPARAVFQAADYDQRVAIIREQPRFVLATISADPVGVAHASLINFATMLGLWQTDEALADPRQFLTDPKFRILAAIVPGGAACAAGEADCAPRLRPRIMNMLVGAGLLLSLSAIAVLFMRNRGLRQEFGGLALLLAVALVGNAAICGIISGPFMRYQSRITWLIPLLAAVLMIASRRARSLGQNGD
jgi:hypothetical protein